ncbi:family A G protein-coupled receptor-like protein [Peniophora sp. CONT]|nr:family A G protein-coupled receptor-like protein [Peniophora sp. CONT]
MDMSDVATRSSIESNPGHADIGLTVGASNWLWVVFAIMLVSNFGFAIWTFARPIGTRTFHYMSVLILATATIAYFSLASNIGGTPVPVQLRGRGLTRAVWYARYIDWTITTPLLLLQLLLGTGLPLSEIFAVIFFDIIMIVTGLVAALVPSGYKWGFFLFSCMSFFFIWGVLIGTGRQSAYFISPEAGKAYTRGALFLIFVWMLYPIAWGLSEGRNVLHPSGEMIFYGILDILAKPVFCAWHLYSLRNVPYEVFALNSGKVSTATSFAHLSTASPVPDKPYTGVGTDSETGNSTPTGIGRGRSSSHRVAAPVYEPDVL